MGPFLRNLLSPTNGVVFVHLALYLVAAVDRLRYLGANLAKLAGVKTEYDELSEKVWLHEDDKYGFEERYVVRAGDKSTVEDKVVSLDGEVECLLQQVRDLLAEKEASEACARKQRE